MLSIVEDVNASLNAVRLPREVCPSYCAKIGEELLLEKKSHDCLMRVPYFLKGKA
jgi:hypothetical protein